jgi:hypothetical protein
MFLCGFHGRAGFPEREPSELKLAATNRRNECYSVAGLQPLLRRAAMGVDHDDTDVLQGQVQDLFRPRPALLSRGVFYFDLYATFCRTFLHARFVDS